MECRWTIMNIRCFQISNSPLCFLLLSNQTFERMDPFLFRPTPLDRVLLLAACSVPEENCTLLMKARPHFLSLDVVVLWFVMICFMAFSCFFSWFLSKNCEEDIAIKDMSPATPFMMMGFKGGSCSKGACRKSLRIVRLIRRGPIDECTVEDGLFLLLVGIWSPS